MIGSRSLAVAALAALVISSGPVAADPPHVQDEGGDVAVAALDVLSATFAPAGAGRTTLRLRLAAPPQLPAVYSVTFGYDGCQELSVDLRWDGAGGAAGRMNATRCTAAAPVSPLQDSPVPVRVDGAVVEWLLPAAAHGYTRGTVLTGPRARTAAAAPALTGDAAVWVSVPYGDATAPGRDYRTAS